MTKMICPKAKECKSLSCLGWGEGGAHNEPHKHNEVCDIEDVCPACIPLEPEPDSRKVEKQPCDLLIPCKACHFWNELGDCTRGWYKQPTPTMPLITEDEIYTLTHMNRYLQREDKAAKDFAKDPLYAFESRLASETCSAALVGEKEGSRKQRDTDMAWLPAHDAEVASKARAEFAKTLSSMLDEPCPHHCQTFKRQCPTCVVTAEVRLREMSEGGSRGQS